MANAIDMLEKGLSPSGEPLKKSSPNIFERAADWLGGLWKDFTGQTNNQMNLDFQRENLDYQKGLQQQIFEREDTAYQRTVNDMRAAGLNPVSMQGTNGSGEAVATESMNSQKTSDIQAVNEIMNVLNQVSVTRNNSTLTNAQANLINAQADNQKIKNLWENDILEKTISNLDLDSIGKRFSNERSNIAWLQDRRNYMFNTQFGLSDNMPDFAKLINYATHQGKLSDDHYTTFSRNWDSFGRTFNELTENPQFSNIQELLEKSNLKGALQENIIGNALLRLIGIY